MAHRKAYDNHVEKLVKCLPMDDTYFINLLASQALLGGNILYEIQTLSTPANKASHFLNHVIKPALDIDETSNFEKLLTVMQKCDYIHLQKLASIIEVEIDSFGERKLYASGT